MLRAVERKKIHAEEDFQMFFLLRFFEQFFFRLIGCLPKYY